MSDPRPNPFERPVRRFDELQQRRRWLGQPVGVVRKYADDRGSALAGLLTFQVFLGMLPLMVVALTVFGRVLEQHDEIRERVLTSALGQFPVLGPRLRDDVSALGVEGPWLLVTIAGLLWTATGIYNGFQLVLNQVWHVGGVERQGFLSRQLRAVTLFVLVFVAALGASFLEEIVPTVTSPLIRTGWTAVAGSLLAGVLLLGVMRLVTSPAVATAQLIPAAIAAGIFWEVLQRVGRWLVTDQLSGSRGIYGAIGFVVVTLSWINLLARSVVLANEIAVVHHRRLWPRRIAQPPLSDADRRVLVGLLNNERRRPEESVTVRFSGEDETFTLGGSDDDR